MTPEQIQEFSEDMMAWGESNAKKSQIKISTKGIEKALEAGADDYERREFDKDVVIFSYIVDSIMYSDLANKKAKLPIARLFEIVNTRTYQQAMKTAKKRYGTDETPSDFMRDLYRQYLAWKDQPYYKKRAMSDKHRNYGALSLETRWELGEFPKESWMDADTTGETDA